MSQYDSAISRGYPSSINSPQFKPPHPPTSTSASTSFFSSNQHLQHSPTQLNSHHSDPPAQLTGPSLDQTPARKKQRTASQASPQASIMNSYHTNGQTTAPTGPISPGLESYGEDSAAEDRPTTYYTGPLPPVPPIEHNGKLLNKPRLKAAKSSQSVRSAQSERGQSVESEAPSKSGGPTKAKLKRSQSADKKKKAGRACASCQKAHLTCDDGKPRRDSHVISHALRADGWSGAQPGPVRDASRRAARSNATMGHARRRSTSRKYRMSVSIANGFGICNLSD